MQRYGTQLLLLCTEIATVGFSFPCLVWATYISYALIALLLTQMMVESSKTLDTSDALYRGLGLISEMVMSALETIQQGSFKPVDMANVGDSSVLFSARLFQRSITTPLPHHRWFQGHQPDAPHKKDGECGHQHRRSALPRCRNGVLIGRFTNRLDRQSPEG